MHRYHDNRLRQTGRRIAAQLNFRHCALPLAKQIPNPRTENNYARTVTISAKKHKYKDEGCIPVSYST